MRCTVGACLIAAALSLGVGHGTARGQVAGGPVLPYRIQSYYSAPGSYGTTFGVASYGVRQTYTTFSSSYGAGYGYGYPPASFLPGPYGVSLWHPGGLPDQYVWRTPYYGTFGIPAAPRNVPLPPIGVYAPAFGPGPLPVRYGW